MPQQPQSRRVVALTLLLALAGGLALITLRTSHALFGDGVVSWWALASLFALTDVATVPMRLRNRTIALGASAAPLVVGLLLASPGDLLAARVLAAALVAAARWDRTFVHVGTSAALAAAGTSAAQAVFATLVIGTDFARLPAHDPTHALAALLGVVVAGLLDTSVVVALADWYEGRTGDPEVSALLLSSLAASLVAGVAGLLTVALDPSATVIGPLAVALAALLLAYRGLGRLTDRHGSLQRLHELSDALVAAPASSDVVGLMLTQSLELAGAQYAEATLDTPDLAVVGPGSGQVGCWVRRAGQAPFGPGPVIHPGVDTLPAVPSSYLVVTGATPVERAFLDARSLRDAVIVPLRSEGEAIGHLVVGDRGRGQSPGVHPRDDDGRLLATVANHASVALRNGRLIHRLHVEARQDELTGLPNRLQLRELLDGTAESSADGGPECTVMVLDFNGFKAINDTLGHQAGDELLRVLAGRLAEAAADTATVARLGGDEFAVLSDRCVGAAQAQALAARLLSVFAEPVTVSGARLRLGGSLGIALGPEHGATGSDLLRNADIAMYSAKAAGGGQRTFSADLVELTAAGLTLATDLRDAIDRAEISVVVQPMVDLVTDQVHSVEVLARWHHQELGEVPPEQFFAAAERSGQVQALSAYVLDQALALSRRWQDDGLRLRVAVNLAPRWLAEPSLPEQVGASLARHGVAADMLCLELTERSVIADPRRAGDTLARLRAMGVHLSVDDFGTGYSSLTYLSRLPVDQMKIDKSFIVELDGNQRDQAIVRSMIDLGRNLGLEVVAEGVMTAAGRRALRELGCRLGQGYLIARPLDPAEMPAYVAERGATGEATAHGPGLPAPRAHEEPAPLPELPGR